MSASLLELDNVCYHIGKAQILDKITLRSDHQRVGIVGRNGSGKSSLARLLCGLAQPSKGSLRVAGIDVAKDRHAAIRTVGMLFQNPDHQIIFPTVEEELSFGLLQLGYSKEQAQEAVSAALLQFNCQAWATKAITTLSQGQRHLVCLISVLLMNPRLIVLDEPYAGLDIPTTMQLQHYLNSVEAALVHISHDPDMLSSYDHILWIDEGRLVSAGTPQDVLPAFKEQMHLLGQSNVIV